MTTPRDDIGLSERLRDLAPDWDDMPVTCRAMLEAASAELDDYKRVALDRLDKLTKAEAHAKELTADRINHTSLCRSLNARATRAEQERDEAYERAREAALLAIRQYKEQQEHTHSHGDDGARYKESGSFFSTDQNLPSFVNAAIRSLSAGPEKEK